MKLLRSGNGWGNMFDETSKRGGKLYHNIQKRSKVFTFFWSQISNEQDAIDADL